MTKMQLLILWFRKKLDEHFLLFSFICGSIVLFFMSSDVHAATATVGSGSATFELFDDLLVTPLTEKSTAMQSAISGLVSNTFIILATIDLCWAAAIWALEKDNMSSFTAELINKIMTIGFFYALLKFGPEWIHLIPDTFRDIGTKAGGFSTPLTVDGVMATGLATVDMIWKELFDNIIDIILNLPFIGLAIFVSIVIVVCFGIAAMQLLALNVETTIILAAGMIFLAFGGSQWTKDYVDKYMTYAMTAGIRLLVLLVILGLLQGLIGEIAGQFKTGFQIVPLLKVMVFGIVAAALSIKGPEMASSLMMGGTGFSASSMKSTAQSLKPMATTPAKAVGGTVNAGKMVSAGVQNAKSEGKSGASAVMSGLGSATKQASSDGLHSLGQTLQGKKVQGADGHAAGGFLQRGAEAMKGKLNEDGATLGKNGADGKGGLGVGGTGGGTGAKGSSATPAIRGGAGDGGSAAGGKGLEAPKQLKGGPPTPSNKKETGEAVPRGGTGASPRSGDSGNTNVGPVGEGKGLPKIK